MSTINRKIAINLIAWAIDEVALGNEHTPERIVSEFRRLADVALALFNLRLTAATADSVAVTRSDTRCDQTVAKRQANSDAERKSTEGQHRETISSSREAAGMREVTGSSRGGQPPWHLSEPCLPVVY